jgi:putative PIN family toxin of toxin-antitoxin system
MRIVFDTNVLIAALITAEGVCGNLVKRCAQVHTPITSEFILAELHEKLTEKFKKEPSDINDAVALIRARFVVVEPTTLEKPACRDPDDDTVLGTALAGEAQCIITGDKDLLSLGQYAGIDIFKPNAFEAYEKKQM